MRVASIHLGAGHGPYDAGLVSAASERLFQVQYDGFNRIGTNFGLWQTMINIRWRFKPLRMRKKMKMMKKQTMKIRGH